MAVIAADTFTRVVADGLGTADTGGGYSTYGTASTLDVDGAKLVVTPLSAYQENGGRLASVSAKDVDITARFAFPTIGSAIGWLLHARGAGTSNRYGTGFECALGYDGTFVTLDVGYWSLGAFTRVTLYTSGLTMTAATLYRVRFEVSSDTPTRLRAKVWVDGTSEPATWGVDSTTFYGPDTTGWVAFTHLSGASTSSGQLYEWSVDDATVPKNATDSGSGVDGASVVPARPYQSEVLADAPRGYWRAGEPSGALLDTSGNAQSGTVVNATRDVVGLIVNGDDGALDFDGLTTYAFIPDNPFLDNGDRYTWECWFRLDTLSGYRGLMSRGGALTGDIWFGVNSSAKMEVFVVPGSRLASSTTTIALATTYHAVFTKNGERRILYLNGADVTDLTGTLNIPTPNGDAPLYIGRAAAGDEIPDGKIDEVATYGTDLPPIRVKAHYLAATGSSQSETAKTGADTGAGVDTSIITTAGNQSGIVGVTLAQDDFTRVVVGGLGTADVGGGYSTHGAAADLSVDGTRAALTLAAAYSEVGGRLALSVADVEGIISWTVTAASAYCWTHVRGQGASNRVNVYEFALLLAGGTVEVEIAHVSATNVHTNIASALLTTPYVSGDTFKVRYSAVGTAFKIKAWKGTVEPGSWHAEVTNDYLGAAGHVGFTLGGPAVHTANADAWLVAAPAVASGGDTGVGVDSSILGTDGVIARMATDTGAADESYAETMTAEAEAGTGSETLPPVVVVGDEVIPPPLVGTDGTTGETEDIPAVIRRSRWRVDTGSRIKF